MGLVRSILKVLFGETGPRREAAEILETQVALAKVDNQTAVVRNLHAVKALIEDTVKMLEDQKT